MRYIFDVFAYGHRRLICRLCGWLKRESGHNWTEWATPPACRFCGTTKQEKEAHHGNSKQLCTTKRGDGPSADPAGE